MKAQENPYSSAALRGLLLANLYHTLNTGYSLRLDSPRTAALKRVFIAKKLRQAGATREEIATLME